MFSKHKTVEIQIQLPQVRIRSEKQAVDVWRKADLELELSRNGSEKGRTYVEDRT
jgi:hypothetical protein